MIFWPDEPISCPLSPFLYLPYTASKWHNKYRTHHHLVNDDSKCKIISLERMIHPTDNFRSHISRSTTCLFRISFFPLPSNPKISDPEIPIFLKHQILRFKIPMNSPLAMYILESQYDTPSNKFYIISVILACSSLKN